jgi:hypothetical protein
VELLAARVGLARFRACFIATAAFGGPFEAEVESLRRFRDQVLARSLLGQLLVRAYETLSPPLAAWLSRSPRARAVVRQFLRPVAGLRRRLDGLPGTSRGPLPRPSPAPYHLPCGVRHAGGNG